MKSWQIALCVLIGVITIAIAVGLGLGFGLKKDASPVSEENDNVSAPNEEVRTASKKKVGDIASTGSECGTGFAELWDNKGSNAAKRCCPTNNVKLISGWSWCSSLAAASTCMHDEQCESGYCRPGATSDHICVTRAKVDADAAKVAEDAAAAEAAGVEAARVEAKVAEDAAAAALVSRDKDAGDYVSAAGQCKNSTAALWSDHGSKLGLRCCRGPTVVSVDGRAFCAELNKDDPCNSDNQCKSGICGTLYTCVVPLTKAAGVSSGGGKLSSAPALPATPQKKITGAVASNGSECTIGFAEFWNNEGSNSDKRCCPTVNTKVINGHSWCTYLPAGSMCIHDEQCMSGYYCSPGKTSDSTCVLKAKSGDVIPVDRGFSGCESGVAALWNNKSIMSNARCCPTPASNIYEGLVWCTKLPNASQCIHNLQCESAYCAPGGTAGSVCNVAPTGMITGKMIRVFRDDQRNEFITLLGIDVFDERGNRITSGITPTISPALYSNDPGRFGPQFLIDGVHVEKTSNGTLRLPHSTADQNAFHQLDLGRDTVISKIVIYNRTSSDSGRINGCRLIVKNSAGGEVIRTDKLSNSSAIYTFDFPNIGGAGSGASGNLPPVIMIKWRDSGKCLDVAAGRDVNGTEFQIYGCSAATNANQRFKYENGQVKWGNSGKCLTVKDGKDDYGTILHLWQCDANTMSQKFTFEGDQIRWGTSGKCVDVKGGLNQNGTLLHLWKCDATNKNQTFNIDSVGSGGPSSGIPLSAPAADTLFTGKVIKLNHKLEADGNSLPTKSIYIDAFDQYGTKITSGVYACDQLKFTQLVLTTDTVISSIVITNRVGEFNVRINGCRLVVTNTAGVTTLRTDILSGSRDTYTFNALSNVPDVPLQASMMTGKYIKVVRADNKNEIINLLGIDVFDANGIRITTGIKAKISPAIWGDDTSHFGPQFLIDGIHKENADDGSGYRFGHSIADVNAYIELELDRDTVISRIIIYNRTVKTTANRINGCNIVVTNAVGSVVLTKPLSGSQATYTIVDGNVY